MQQITQLNTTTNDLLNDLQNQATNLLDEIKKIRASTNLKFDQIEQEVDKISVAIEHNCKDIDAFEVQIEEDLDEIIMTQVDNLTQAEE